MICKSGKLAASVRRLRKAGRKIVFTNGCYDIIHPGHIKLLKKARSFGDILVVGLNSSSSVRKIKPGRPINSYKYRSLVLDALKYVDFVCGFNSKTPYELIKKLRPDVLVKGGDWKTADIVGGSYVRSYGGNVVTVKLEKGFSTTAIIKKIRK